MDNLPIWLSGAYLQVIDLRDLQRVFPDKAQKLQQKELDALAVLDRVASEYEERDVAAAMSRPEVEAVMKSFSEYGDRLFRGKSLSPRVQIALELTQANPAWWDLEYFAWRHEIVEATRKGAPSESTWKRQIKPRQFIS